MRLPAWTPSLGPLVRADLRQRYAGSRLGAAWALLGPLAEVAAYALVFSWLTRPESGLDGTGFVVFVAAGLLPWSALREALEGSAGALVENRWIRRSRVPMELLVARAAVAAAPRGAVGVVLVVGFALSRGELSGLAAIAMPPLALGLQTLASYGLGLALAPLAALHPDLRPGLTSALTLLTFGSPILIPEGALPPSVLAAMQLNPFTHLLRLYRMPLAAEAARFGAADVGVVLAAALALLALGAWVGGRFFWAARDRL
jgi:ABC-type polysaccharide/polyol phosphate export permease